MNYDVIAYADTSLTVRFEMWASGQLQTGATVSGLWLSVSGDTYANISTMTNPTVTEYGSTGSYYFVVADDEIGSSEGFAKLLFSAAGCDDVVITIRVVSGIPAIATTLEDKTGMSLAWASWVELMTITFDGIELREIITDLADFLLAPNTNSPSVKSMDGAVNRYWFTTVDDDGYRTTAAERYTDDLEDPIWS